MIDNRTAPYAALALLGDGKLALTSLFHQPKLQGEFA
jgi:hypothetical protein